MSQKVFKIKTIGRLRATRLAAEKVISDPDTKTLNFYSSGGALVAVIPAGALLYAIVEPRK